MDYAEFVEWQLFNNHWPIGEKRQDMNFAQMCSVMASAWGSKPIPMKEFMLFSEDRGIEPVDDVEAEPITDADLSAMFGGKVKRIKPK